MVNYKFFIHRERGRIAPIETHPIYKDDLTINYERETNYMFYRKKLSGKLSFVRVDYEYIMATDFEEGLILEIHNRQEDGTYNVYWRGKFYHSDCTINEDDRIIEVQPDPEDEYTELLSGVDNEYDIIRLLEGPKQLDYKKPPVVQVYTENSQYISNFIGVAHTEIEVSEKAQWGTIVDKYHFADGAVAREFYVTDSQDPRANGAYYAINHNANKQITGVWSSYYYNDSGYTLKVSQSVNESKTALFTQVIAYDSNGEKIYAYEELRDPLWVIAMFSWDFQLQPQGTMQGVANVKNSRSLFFTRVLLNNDTFRGNKTLDVPTEDIAPTALNYKKCYNLKVGKYAFIQSARESFEPTQWGKNPNGNYYVQPKVGCIPICKDRWNYTSLWYQPNNDEITQINNDGSQDMTLKDAYSLADAIKIILKQYTDITFDETAEYSQFLYGNCPLVTDKIDLFLTQKTNILKSNYTNPAQTGKTKLSEILKTLQNLFDVHWYVEDNKLHLEHRYFFINNLSYESTTGQELDLTEIKARNGKSLIFGTNQYSYDKQDMPERYEYAFGEDVTNIFTGEPVQILSKFVTRGKKEEINVSNFITDLDVLLFNPSGYSEDGFVLMNAPNNSVQTTNVQWQGDVFSVQNGLLSFPYLQRTFLCYNFPSRRVLMQGEEFTNNIIQFGKKQTLTFPIGYDDISPYTLIKTGIGIGHIQSMQINLSTRSVKVQLQYQTY